MVLSFKELRKRDVVNIKDGRSFGKITDLKIDFPCAVMKGIVVSDKKCGGLFGFLHKNEIFIDEKQIVRIGGDVILVNIDHCESVAPAVVDINVKTEASGGTNKKSTVKCPPCPKPEPPVSPCDPCCPPPVLPCAQDLTAEIDESAVSDFEEY